MYLVGWIGGLSLCNMNICLSAMYLSDGLVVCLCVTCDGRCLHHCLVLILLFSCLWQVARRNSNDMCSVLVSVTIVRGLVGGGMNVCMRVCVCVCIGTRIKSILIAKLN